MSVECQLHFCSLIIFLFFCIYPHSTYPHLSFSLFSKSTCLPRPFFWNVPFSGLFADHLFFSPPNAILFCFSAYFPVLWVLQYYQCFHNPVLQKQRENNVVIFKATILLYVKIWRINEEKSSCETVESKNALQ